MRPVLLAVAVVLVFVALLLDRKPDEVSRVDPDSKRGQISKFSRSPEAGAYEITHDLKIGTWVHADPNRRWSAHLQRAVSLDSYKDGSYVRDHPDASSWTAVDRETRILIADVMIDRWERFKEKVEKEKAERPKE